MDDILEKFTSHSREALQKAVELAFACNQKFVRTEHLLFGLLEEKGSIGHELLHKLKLEPEKLRAYLASETDGAQAAPTKPTKKEADPEIKFSAGLKQVIKKSVLTAYLYKHQYVGTEHLLAAMLETNDAGIKKVLAEFKINFAELQRQVLSVLKSTSKFPDLTDTFQGLKEQNLSEAVATPNFLEFFAAEITAPDYLKKVDPVFCREEEIERLIEVLLRRTKNNPVLLGEPGVGKTAIVEGLAKRIYEKNVPSLLLDKKIISLDLSAVVAGSMYRGEFENRLKQIVEEVMADPDIILFIDEIHTITGAGAAMGSLDAANILKPALARGQLRCIGATTHDDYRKNIEKDQALARRFQPILIKEPSLEQTIEMIEGIKKNYEIYHRVKISKEAIEAAVKLADRYIPDRFFPDKALDLIDEASAKAKLKRGETDNQKNFRELKKKLDEISLTKRQSILDEKFSQASQLKKEEDRLLKEIDLTEKLLGAEKISDKNLIRPKNICEVVSRLTGIPLAELVQDDRERLLKLEENLGHRIVGQKEALTALASSIKRNRLGINNRNKPIGSFIFLGPSGVGKTETAKALAEVVFEDPKALIRLDMSEYGEKFNVSKLIGAPAGYVGYEESGLLTEQVRRRPYSVILFDELEKAHPDVFHLLLQILDEGHITDAAGRKINFKNTIIILTSNLGTEGMSFDGSVGFASGKTENRVAQEWPSIKNQMLKNLKETFRPELLNRFDRVIFFEPLAKDQINRIFDLKINELEKRLLEHRLKLKMTPAAQQFIISYEADPAVGARLISRNIANLLESPLADYLLKSGQKANQTVSVILKNKKIVLE